MITKYIQIGIVLIAFGGGVLFDAKVLRPKINLTCPPAPACKCPEQKPCNGIDFDKIKSKNITIQNEQHLTVSGDSVMIESIRKMINEEVDKSFKRNIKGKFLQSSDFNLQETTDTTKTLLVSADKNKLIKG